MGIQCCEYTKIHCFLHFKRVAFMVYKFYLKKKMLIKIIFRRQDIWVLDILHVVICVLYIQSITLVVGRKRKLL